MVATEREALLYVYFLFFDRRKVFQSDRKIVHEGTGIFFLSIFFGFIFIVFAVLLCRAVLSLSMSKEEKAVFRTAVHTASMSKEEKDYPTSGMYVRTACERA